MAGYGSRSNQTNTAEETGQWWRSRRHAHRTAGLVQGQAASWATLRQI